MYPWTRWHKGAMYRQADRYKYVLHTNHQQVLSINLWSTCCFHLSPWSASSSCRAWWVGLVTRGKPVDSTDLAESNESSSSWSVICLDTQLGTGRVLCRDLDGSLGPKSESCSAESECRASNKRWGQNCYHWGWEWLSIGSWYCNLYCC